MSVNPLDGLNSQQQAAVAYCDGPQLIFAGAGSGKTKVLTHKIAYIIESGRVAPQSILAVTFTNKAARELQARITQFVGRQSALVTVGTFHSICARILRREIENLDGYTRYFSIYDETDQQKVVKKIISDTDFDPEGYTPRNILGRISYLKNWQTGPEAFKPRQDNRLDLIVKAFYPLYQKVLVQSNAVDFDDLLLLPLLIFREFPETRDKYRLKYQYILVDEYQDTNKPQFDLINLLAKEHRNVCVVGDDDQSIYSWRGANVENILKFDSHYPDCRVFKLEQNYRSTNNILNAATAVVVHNINRAQKTLWSQKPTGDRLIKIEADSDYDEAAGIAAHIQKEIIKNKRVFKDFAILYRTNAQTRVLEEILRRNNIPYNIVGGTKFYERKEIRDILAYFSIFSNPQDEIGLRRILNFPPRGIGEKTLQQFDYFARRKGITLFDALAYLELIDLSNRATNAIRGFLDMLARIRGARDQLGFEEWSRVVIDEIGLRKYYKEQGGEEAIQRLANIDELLSDISEYCHTTDDANLEDYLERVSLITDIDTWEDQKNAVSLMTLHSAKGLEFPVVFICGLNQGLFPLERDTSDKALEEERRLFYVGLTRAMDKVFLATAQRRSRAGEIEYLPESRFFSEIPPEVLETAFSREGIISASRQPHARRGRRQDSAIRDNDSEISAGSRVSHKIFGVGHVLSVNGSGGQAKLRINFRSCGVKTIVARFVTRI